MVTVAISGGDAIARKLESLTVKLRGPVLRSALTQTAAPIEAYAKAVCPVSDLTGESVPGVLRDSISTKFTARIGGGTYTGSFGMVIIGPRRGIRVPIRVVTRGPRKGQLKVAVPTKYAHLVEFGHLLKDSTGKVIGHVGPRAYMRPAWDAEGGVKALDRFAGFMIVGLDAALSSP